MNFLADVDEIWHAGDFGSQETADKIAAFKPLVGVYGNIDGGTTRIVYPEFNSWKCEGVNVLMTHIGGYPGRYNKKAFAKIMQLKPDLFIAGHSHILKVQYDKNLNILHINPGSAGKSGFHTVRTAVRMEIIGNEFKNLEVGEWKK